MKNRSLLLTSVFALVLLLFSLPALAQEEGNQQVDLGDDGVNYEFPEVDEFDDFTHVRFLHVAPGAGAVDIYLNGEQVASSVGFETLGDWQNMVAGGYDIAITPAGESMDNAVVELDSFQFPRGQWTTAAVVLDNEGTPAIVTAVEDFSEPLPGTTNVTFLNALSMDNDVTFTRDGVPYIANLGQMAADINSYSYAIPMDTEAYNFGARVEIDQGLIASERQLDLQEAASYLIAVYGDTENNAQLIVDETTRTEFAELRGLLPEGGTVVDALFYTEELRPYARMMAFTGLYAPLYAEGPYTVFIPAGFLADEILTVAFEDAALLEQILTAHVYQGEALYSSDLIERDSLIMVNGNEIPVIVQDDAIFVGGAQVLEVNIPANNGVIHVLGYVIDPTLDQEDYDLFDDAVNLANNANPGVVSDLEAQTESMGEDE